MVLSIIFLADKHKIVLHLSIFYEYQQFFQHRICFSIQPPDYSDPWLTLARSTSFFLNMLLNKQQWDWTKSYHNSWTVLSRSLIRIFLFVYNPYTLFVPSREATEWHSNGLRSSVRPSFRPCANMYLKVVLPEIKV